VLLPFDINPNGLTGVKVIHGDVHEGVGDDRDPLHALQVQQTAPANEKGDYVVVHMQEDQRFLVHSKTGRERREVR